MTLSFWQDRPALIIRDTERIESWLMRRLLGDDRVYERVSNLSRQISLIIKKHQEVFFVRQVFAFTFINLHVKNHSVISRQAANRKSFFNKEKQ